MKVLSLLQPWASLVVLGLKKIEIRSWRTSHRGGLLIHASVEKRSRFINRNAFKKYVPHFYSLPFGAIVGSVMLDDIVAVEMLQLSDARMNAHTLEEKAFGDYSKGRYAWLLSEPVEFKKPINIRGSLNLWEYTGEPDE
jgi:predicted transcriptional regulator